MLNVEKDWLPLGTVVRLKGGEKPVFISGYMSIEGATKQVFDYSGHPYPEGLQNDGCVFFDREQIDEVYQLGYADAEGLAFLEYLETAEGDYLAQKVDQA